MVTRTEATATGLLKVDPSRAACWARSRSAGREYMTLQDAPDAKEHNEKYGDATSTSSWRR